MILAGCQSVVQESAAPAEAPPIIEAERINPSRIISPDELLNRLDDPGLVLVHVGHGDGTYRRAHLPGARYAEFLDLFIGQDLHVEMPPPAQAEALVRSLGIDDSSTVVLLGDSSGVFAARVYLMLEYFGLNAEMYLLDGQMKGWKARGLPATTELSAPAEPTSWSASIQPGVLATAADVEKALADENGPFVVDVRPASQFSGERRSAGVEKRGRIEGAINFPWDSVLAGHNPPWMKPEAEIRRLLVDAGLDPDRSLIIYDTAGIHASMAWVILKHLGYEVALYDGGYEEWSER